ncbi:MAG TPA: acyl-CoA thioester hydrolase/BAAT C-terminal domain-containing protein [Candidatus Synoicihabitans sp.]|nr:acyl-CoA thioester hydrolase/BAAT C-terminal domain-containing protein [Candidatus Synoicihabitans sp.]
MIHRICFFAWAFIAIACGVGCSGQHEHKVIWQKVREDGLVATYLQPKGDELRSVVVVVGGSDGGLKSAEQLAFQFARAGWAALAVAYFGMEGLPSSLANIPLEYFDGAVVFLRRQPGVRIDDLTIVGSSRGGELALLVAAHNPAFRRVIAVVPSHVSWGPVGQHDASVAAWTFGGRALPFVRPVRAVDYSARPYFGTPDFMADLAQTDSVAAATIPVERINGPVLLLSGEDDQVWPSTYMSERVIERLAAKEHPYSHKHVSFPGAGHLILPGPDPSFVVFDHPTGVQVALGGNRQANRVAQRNAWAEVLGFLRQEIPHQ